MPSAASARTLADARDVPAFVIFSDVALRQMAREYPTDPASFRRINGVGDKKLADLGPVFLPAIAAHVAAHGKQGFDEPAAPPAPTRALGDSGRETLRRLRDGEPLEAIASGRGLAVSTIWGHIIAAAEAGEAVALDRLLTPDQQARMSQVFTELGTANLAGALERLGPGFSYGQVRLYRAVRQREAAPPS